MPRRPRTATGGYVCHVLNRAVGRATIFETVRDYDAFEKILREAAEQVPGRLLAYCLMPNHFHLTLWPRGDGDLSRFMQWLLTAHVRRDHRHYQSNGHVWQGRFKAFPIQQDAHLLTLLRYIERNPLRGVSSRGRKTGCGRVCGSGDARSRGWRRCPCRDRRTG